MKPILFAKNETNFTTNGLGRLDCISCEVVEERNGIYELEAEIPITGAHANEIEMHSIIGVIPHEGSNIQAFYVYKIGKPISGRFRVYGRHISYRLTDIPCMPFSVASSPQAAAQTLAGLKSNAIEACPFNFDTDITTPASYTQKTPASIRQRLGGVEGSVIDQYGGEFEWDNWNVRLLKARGRLANVTGISLRYGKNITDLDQEEEIASTVTGVVPFWVDTDGNNLVTLPEHAVYAPTAGNYPYHLTQVLDLSSEYQDKPTVAQLRSTANVYVHKSGFGVPKVSIKVSFVDLWKSEEYKDIAPLEQVKLCDEITVDFEKLGVKAIAKVVKTTYDVLRERYTQIEVGSIRSTLAQAITDRDKDIDTAFVNELTRVNTAISNATAWLTSANGYVVARKNEDGTWKELLFMDTNNPQTATNGIRINEHGIGIWRKSIDGGNVLDGPYANAWTIDGKLIADWIKTGMLGDAADKNHWNMTTGDFALAASTTVGGKTVDEIAEGAVSDMDGYDVMKKITDDFAHEGMWIQNNHLYINGTAIVVGIISDKLNKNSWNMDNGAFSLQAGVTVGGKTIPTIAGESVSAYDATLNQMAIYNKLTNGQSNQGIWLDSSTGKLYINGEMMGAGTILIGGSSYLVKPALLIKDRSNREIGSWTSDGIVANKGSFGLLTIEADSSSIKAVGSRYMRKFVIPYSTKQRSRTYQFTIGAKYFVDNFTLHFSKPTIIRGPVESGNYIGTVGVGGLKYNSSTGQWEQTYFFGGIGFTDQNTIGDILVDWKTRGFSETDKISIGFANWPTNPCKFSIEVTVLNTTTLLLSAARNIGEFSGGFRGTFEGTVNEWSWDDDSSQMQVQTNFYNNYYSTTGFGLGFKEYSGDTQSVLRWLPEDGRLLLRSNRSTSDERGIIVSNYNPDNNDSNNFSGSGCYYTIHKPTSFLAKKNGSNNYGSLEYDRLIIGDDSSYSSKVIKDRVEVGSSYNYSRLTNGGLQIIGSSDSALLNVESLILDADGTISTMVANSSENALNLNHGSGRQIYMTANNDEATLRICSSFASKWMYAVSRPENQDIVRYDGSYQSVSWNTSDRRAKENIEELDTELSKNLIDATETKRFKYKGKDGIHYGMIAQDARELLDSLGETESDLEHSMHITGPDAMMDDQRTIDYHEYIPHLINYVKDLRAVVDRQQAEIDELKEIVKRLTV